MTRVVRALVNRLIPKRTDDLLVVRERVSVANPKQWVAVARVIRRYLVSGT